MQFSSFSIEPEFLKTQRNADWAEVAQSV